MYYCHGKQQQKLLYNTLQYFQLRYFYIKILKDSTLLIFNAYFILQNFTLIHIFHTNTRRTTLHSITPKEMGIETKSSIKCNENLMKSV